jgi:hypothetical protein
MPEDGSCSRHSAACLMTLSLHNWNCVDGEGLTSTEVVISSDIMVWLLAEAWPLGIQNMNQECCRFGLHVS